MVNYKVIFVLALLFSVLSTVIADDANILLKPEAEPVYGEFVLESGFEPAEFQVTMPAGGLVDVSYLGGKCVGFTDQNPSIMLTWQSNNEYLQINFVGVSQLDTTLVVLAPDGNYYCDDDSLYHPNPLLEWVEALPGEYFVWVATYTAGDWGIGDLVITQTPPEPFNTREVALITSIPTYGSTSLEAGTLEQPYVQHIPYVQPDIRASTVRQDCAGFVTFAPSFRLRWQGESEFLRFYLEGRGTMDAVLLIRDPENNIYCDDDSYTAYQPMITITDPAPGNYDIWVGTYYPQFTYGGHLFIDDRITSFDQQQQPNTQLDPDLPSVVVMRNRLNDYRFSDVEVYTGGPIDISYLGEPCEGTAAVQPDLSFNLTFSDYEIEENTFLRFLFEGYGETPTNVVVLDPLGQYHCGSGETESNWQRRLISEILLEPIDGYYTVWLASQHPYFNNFGSFRVNLFTDIEFDYEAYLPTETIRMDHSAEPTYGTVILEEGFVSQPRQIGINHTGNSFFIRCETSINSAPDLNIEWRGESSYLRLTFQRPRANVWDNQSLVVRDPEGNYHCVIASETVLEVHLEFEGMIEGIYNVWTGNGRFNDEIIGTLLITQEQLEEN